MIGARSLRSKLILVFIAGTLVPLALTVWTSIELLDFSLTLTPVGELDDLSRSFERVSREYYQRARDWLKADAGSGRVDPAIYRLSDRAKWPSQIQEFEESGAAERFAAGGANGQVLMYLTRTPADIRVYSRELGIGMEQLTREYSQARAVIAQTRGRNLRRGFVYTFIAVAAAAWIAGALVLVFFARRITTPVHRLTQALRKVGQGDLEARVHVPDRDDEIGSAIAAFNSMADQLRDSREKLIHMTRLASWQALARKTAHEVKNSLTPIRLTMEEISARSSGPDSDFLRQAAQIVVDEVTSLEKRVRAFSEFAAEPPVCPEAVDINPLLEERVSFLRSANPDIRYQFELAPGLPPAQADPDLLKGIVTNLVQNAAEAARPRGVVLLRSTLRSGRITIEVHDSGPGLSPQARSTVFEPAISFKKGGMGLGLSIARKSALLCGGDIALIDGELRGAGFRVVIPAMQAKATSEPERGRPVMTT